MNTITVPARPENVASLLELVQKAAEAAGLDETARFDILVAAEEMIFNIVNYAYTGGSGDIRLDVDTPADRPGLRLRLEDQGIAFNPQAHPEPDITKPVADRPIGGLGIFIARRKTDRLGYERRDGANILILEKHLPPKGGKGDRA